MLLWETTPLLTALLAALTTLTSVQGQIQECTYDANVCGCKTEKGVISLRKYSDKPLYAQDPQNYEYHWNPCKDFTMGTTTSACIQHLPGGDDYDCGSYDSTTTVVQGGQAVFKLKSNDGKRSSSINCVCKENEVDVFEFEGEFPPGTYDLQLTGSSCCPGAAPSPSSSGNSGGLSGGSILLIVFLVSLVVYLLAGVAFQTGVRKARGKESLPNIGFWSALPGLIKDGVRFTFSCGKQSSYNQI